MTLPILLFFLGLIVLVKCGDVFVNSSIALARRFHLSELFIGTTIVSIGTTLPEVTVSITAALSGQSQLAYGNAVGSVICNTALIAGLSLAIRPLPISKFSFVNIVIAFFLAAGFCIFI
ncbi:MAG: sodium:calcium antiporter, partial [Clostridia bacterium]